MKRVRADDLEWLRGWLDSYGTADITAAGLVTDAAACKWCSLGDIVRPESGSSTGESRAPGATVTAPIDLPGPARDFVAQVARLVPGFLITSPDEASSNTVDIEGVEIRELLSEPVTFAWALGAAAAGRASMWATYEAFAPIVTTIVAQYLRHVALAISRPAELPIVVVTSLSTRNVSSHQDVAWIADLEHRHLQRVAFHVPPSDDHISSTARVAAQQATSGTAMPIVFVDKYPTGPIEPADEVIHGVFGGWDQYRYGSAAAKIRHVVVALGAAAFREACRAATLIATREVRCDVMVLRNWGPGMDAREVGTRLFDGAESVAAVSTVESHLFNAVVSHAGDRGAHVSVWRPAGGSNEAARLAEAGISAYAIAAALGHASKSAGFREAAAKLVSQLASSRNGDWYSLEPFAVTRARLEEGV